MIARIMLAAAVVLALLAAPSIATADSVDYENGNFTVEGGETVLQGAEIEAPCTSVSGGGVYTSATKGVVEYTYKGCSVLGFPCASAGQPSGTGTTTTLSFHVVEIPKLGPAVLVKPNKGHVMTLTCLGGLITIIIGGNGVVGEVASPGYGESSSDFDVSFASSGTEQEFTTVEEDETEYGLEVTVNGGEPEPVGLNSDVTSSFEEGEGLITE